MDSETYPRLCKSLWNSSIISILETLGIKIRIYFITTFWSGTWGQLYYAFKVLMLSYFCCAPQCLEALFTEIWWQRKPLEEINGTSTRNFVTSTGSLAPLEKIAPSIWCL